LAQKSDAAKTSRKLTLGDDPIGNVDTDWFEFTDFASSLVRQLYGISVSSGVCCGIEGPWGSGKSSLMKLMAECVTREYPTHASVAWFTAWDPGGIEDLGDALLFRLFDDIAKANPDLSDAFKELQEGLGMRRSHRERMRQALRAVSEVAPQVGRPAERLADALLEDLGSSRKVQQSFDKLVDWLDKNDRLVFLFVDDIDRASGEEIRDLLSELKVYVSHRRIVVVLGYDGEYVVDALKPPVLPVGTDPRRYLEKIVTIRRSIPLPTWSALSSYALRLLEVGLGLDTAAARGLARSVVRLSMSNPRRLKSLILTFAGSVPLRILNGLDQPSLASMFVAHAAVNFGLVSDDSVRDAMNSGDEDKTRSALQELAKKDPSRSAEANLIVGEVEHLSPRFAMGTLQTMRMAPGGRYSLDLLSPGDGREETHKRFDWASFLSPVLSNAAKGGFKLSEAVVESAQETVVPPSTEVKSGKAAEGRALKVAGTGELGRLYWNYELSWDKCNMFIIVVSRVSKDYGSDSPAAIFSTVGEYFDKCPNLVRDRSCALWVIDDVGRYEGPQAQSMIATATAMSEGLKHPFVFMYTSLSKIEPLLGYLARIAGSTH
jgi:hypothetical protein